MSTEPTQIGVQSWASVRLSLKCHIASVALSPTILASPSTIPLAGFHCLLPPTRTRGWQSHPTRAPATSGGYDKLGRSNLSVNIACRLITNHISSAAPRSSVSRACRHFTCQSIQSSDAIGTPHPRDWKHLVKQASVANACHNTLVSLKPTGS